MTQTLFTEVFPLQEAHAYATEGTLEAWQSQLKAHFSTLSTLPQMRLWRVNAQSAISFSLAGQHDIATRIATMKRISEWFKSQKIIGSAYNATTHPNHFTVLDFVPNLTYGEQRVRPYAPQTLGNDFLKGKLHRKHIRFSASSIRIAVINTLDEKIDDFLEAMRRLLEREFGFTIEMIKERKVRVLSAKNIESAVRAIEKELPHVLFAFIPPIKSLEKEMQDTVRHIKSLTLGKGIASQVIEAHTMHDLDKMPLIAMSSLAKAGNLPFVLSEPLEYADYVVGLDVVREHLTKHDRVATLARIYTSEGAFMRYAMDTQLLEHGQPVPIAVMQTLFPIELFQNQRVIVHHYGEMLPDTVHLLERWGKAIGAQFMPVLLTRHNTPFLYAMQPTQGIVAPEWGSIFVANAQHALLTTTHPTPHYSSPPLEVHLPLHSSLDIMQAIYSVLTWTMLHYGANSHTLQVTNVNNPVTIHESETLLEWLAKGQLPAQPLGDVPFWL